MTLAEKSRDLKMNDRPPVLKASLRGWSSLGPKPGPERGDWAVQSLNHSLAKSLTEGL